jgi:hypothetical protein
MTAGPPRCAWPLCDKPARAHTRGSPPLYCGPPHANLAKHARGRRAADPWGAEFWLVLIFAAHRGHLTPPEADALAAHHGRDAGELATTLDALTAEQHIVRTGDGWAPHPEAMIPSAVLDRLGKPGRNPGPSTGHKPGGNPGPSKPRQTRKPGGNPGGQTLDSAPLSSLCGGAERVPCGEDDLGELACGST